MRQQSLCCVALLLLVVPFGCGQQPPVPTGHAKKGSDQPSNLASTLSPRPVSPNVSSTSNTTGGGMLTGAGLPSTTSPNTSLPNNAQPNINLPNAVTPISASVGVPSQSPVSSSAGHLQFQVASQETKEFYQYIDIDYRNPSGVRTIAPNTGQALLVAKLSVQNDGIDWETFTSSSFKILDAAGTPVATQFIGFANTISVAGSMVMQDWSTVSINGEALLKFKGSLNSNDPSQSRFDWQIAPGKSWTETFVFVIPATVQGAKLQVVQK